MTSDQSAIADEAIERVRAARDDAQAAIDGRSDFLAYVIGATASAEAQDESLRQTQKILDQLYAKRPGLTAEGLPGFLDLAAAGASVGDLIAGASQLTGDALYDQVVTPSLNTIMGAVKIGVPVAVIVIVTLYFLTHRR